MKINLVIKKYIQRIKHSKFLNNTSWMMGERIYQMLISLIVGLLTARYLGPSNYGIINYISAFISFGIPICGLGLEGVIIKMFIDYPQEDEKLVGTSIFMEFCTSIIVSFVIIGIVFISNVGDWQKIIVALLESFYLLFKSTEAIEFWYQSQLKSKYTAIVKILGYTCMSLYRILLLVLHKSVIWFAFATSLDMMIIAILYIFLYKKNKKKFLIDFSLGKKLLKSSYHFIISGLMVVIYSQMDKVMIQYMLGDKQVGLYSAAYTICSLWFFVPAALISSARPLIMQEKNNNEKMYLLRLEQLYAGIFWLGIFIGVIVSIFSKLIIYILYGIQYMEAVGALIIGIWYGLFAQLGNARGIWILCEHKNRYVKLYLMWGAIINIILNWIFIKLIGINGAALATLITQFITCVITPLFYEETRIHTQILWEGISFQWFKKIYN